MPTRQPIVCVLGHVDVGKTALLDKIRGTAVTLREPGAMTQHIGASFLPWSALEKIYAPLLRERKIDIKIPGFLIIDTPGHEVFFNLRRRGGAIADFAILVIDIIEGMEQQTYESIEILKARKTPFIIAINKVDKITGWKSHPDLLFAEAYVKQTDQAAGKLEELVYDVVAQLKGQGFKSDRFDRVRDFAKVVCIVPTSAKTGEGIPELLVTLAGLVQRFMMERLQTTEGPAKGAILEITEEVGLGKTADTIIYDGVLRRGDQIVLGSSNEPIVTKVRSLLLPKPLDEIRSPEDKFQNVPKLSAAAGVKIVAAGLDTAISGAPLLAVWEPSQLEEAKRAVAEEVSSLRVTSDIEGVILKTDTLGSLEALVQYLKDRNVPIRLADIGPVSKRDVIEASVVREKNPYLGVILAFNIKMLPDAEEEIASRRIPFFTGVIVYRMLEDYFNWQLEEKKKEATHALGTMISPAIVKFMPGHVFRRSDPAIVGVEILKGKLRPGSPLMHKDGKTVGLVMAVQAEGKSVKEAERGSEVAVSIKGDVLVGRQIHEGDVLYTELPEADAKNFLTLYKSTLSPDELEALNEIVNIKRKENLFWAV